MTKRTKILMLAAIGGVMMAAAIPMGANARCPAGYIKNKTVWSRTCSPNGDVPGACCIPDQDTIIKNNSTLGVCLEYQDKSCH